MIKILPTSLLPRVTKFQFLSPSSNMPCTKQLCTKLFGLEQYGILVSTYSSRDTLSSTVATSQSHVAMEHLKRAGLNRDVLDL